MMNKLPPEVANLLMNKVIEKLKEGNIQGFAVKFEGESEDEDEMSMGKESEGSAEMCSKCGHKCSMEDNYCPSCGNDLNKEEMKEEKVKEKQGDNGGSNEEYSNKEQEMRDLEEEKDYLEAKNIENLKKFSKK